MSLRSPRRIVKLALVAALAILVAGGIRAARELTRSAPLAGVALGMTVDEVRHGLQPPAPGFFMVGSEGGEPLLEWHPRGRGRGAPAGARFRFAEGRLVEARFGWAPGVTPAEAARQLSLPAAPADARWPLAGGHARFARTSPPEIVYD